MALGIDEPNPFIEALQPRPEAPKTGFARGATIALKGASLGVLGRDVQAEGIGENILEIGASLPTAIGLSAVATPAAAAALRLGTTGARIAAATGTGALVGGLKGAVDGEPLQQAATDAALFAAAEAAFIGGGKVVRALRGAKIASAGEHAIPEAPASVTAPAIDIVDKATQAVPSLPPGPTRLALPAARTGFDIVDTPIEMGPVVKDLPALGKGEYPLAVIRPEGPFEPLFKMASYGKKIDAQSRDLGEEVRRAGRVTFDEFVERPAIPLLDARANRMNEIRSLIEKGIDVTPVFQAPPTSEVGQMRQQLAKRFGTTPEVLAKVESMDQEAWDVYVRSTPGAAEAIAESGANPSQVWRAVQLTSRSTAPLETQFQPVGGVTKQFREVFDETLQKRILVPITKEADEVVKALRAMPEPRQIETQLDSEQAAFFNTPRGREVIKQMDTVSQREPLLTSNVVKQTEEEAARIVETAEPTKIINGIILNKTAHAQDVSAMIRKLELTHEDVDAMILEAQRVAKKTRRPEKEVLYNILRKRCQ